jgi:hypothetical protein
MGFQGHEKCFLSFVSLLLQKRDDFRASQSLLFGKHIKKFSPFRLQQVSQRVGLRGDRQLHKEEVNRLPNGQIPENRLYRSQQKAFFINSGSGQHLNHGKQLHRQQQDTILVQKRRELQRSDNEIHQRTVQISGWKVR